MTASPDRAGLREDDVRALNDAARTLIEALERHGLDNLALFEQQIEHLRGHLFSDAALATGDSEGPGLDVELRAKLLHMANIAAEKRPMTDVARGYERACDELLEWLAARLTSGDAPKEKP